MNFFGKSKTWAWLAALAMLVACLYLLASAYLEVRQENLQQWSTQQSALSKGIAKGIEGLFSRLRGSLNYLAEDPDVVAMNRRGEEILASYFNYNQGPIRALTRIDQTGRIVHTWPPNPGVIGLDVSSQEHNARALGTQKPVVSEVFQAVQGYQAVAFTVPVFEQGSFKGCLALLISFEDIVASYLEDIGLGQGEHAWALSQKGRIIYRSASGPDLAPMLAAGSSSSLSALRDRMLQQETGTGAFQFPGRTDHDAPGPLELAAFHPISLGDTFWSVAIAAPEEQILEIMSDFTAKWLLIMALLAGTVTVGCYMIVKAWAILAETRERQQAEEALRESEQRFRAIFDSSFQFIGLLSPDGRVREANRSALDFAGLGRQDVVGRFFWDTPWWRDDEKQKLLLQEAIAQAARGEFVRLEVENHGAGGAMAVLDFSLKPVFDPAGQVVMLIPEARDITDRKNMAEELKASRDRLRKAQNMAQVGNWEMDLASREMWWSEECLRIFGLEGIPPGSLGIDTFRALVHADDLPLVQKAGMGLVSDGLPIDIEFRFQRASDPEPRHAHSRAELLRDAQGNPAKIAATVQDITQRKQAETALHLTQFCFDNASMAIFLLTLQGRILQVNHQACRSLQYTPQELCSMTIFEIDPLFTPDKADRGPEMWGDTGTWVFETLHRRKDGTTFPVEIVSNEMERGDEKLSLAFVSDITERKRAAREKEALEAQLLHAQKLEAVGRLAGGVAHDFNNMLTVIMGYAEIMKSSLPSDSPHHGNLDQIEKAALRSRDITRQLLAFSRKQIIATKPQVLNELISGIGKTLTRLIGEDVHLLLHLMDGLWSAKVDPSQIDQILVNLAVNARDAMPHGGKLSIETCNAVIDERNCGLHVDCSQPGDYVMVAVSDTGMGMDRETVQHIFEPFFTTKPVGKGTGLGLATVYGIVKQNNGFISVYSEPGRGTTFKIYLPRHRGGHEPAEADAPARLETGTGTILLVEDDELVRNVAASMLEDLGYSVINCGSPGEAIHLCQDEARHLDLLVTDVIMPEMNGKELSEKIRGLRPGLAVLFISGYSNDIIAHHGVLDQGVHLLSKPFNLVDLSGKVKQAMA